jgi:ribosome-associated protein
METFKIKEDHIQLNQLLKALGWCENGADANSAIENNEVMVNGEVELRKRNKIRQGFKVEFNGKTVVIE